MNNFDWTKFTRRISIAADMQTVYDAWSQAEKLETWFLASARFVNSENIELTKNSSAKAGDQYEWTWYAQNASETGRVLAADGRTRFAFTFAGDCTTEIILSRNGNETMVELTQRDIPTDDASKRNIRLGCASGWEFYMVNLKSVLEGGLDLRNREPQNSPVINE